MLGTLGWIALGVAALVVLNRFWDDIAAWLNNTAADAVGRVLGYNARNHMQKAVAIISKLRDNLHNRTIIYTKRKPTDLYFEKVTCEANAPIYQIETDVLKEINKNGGQLVKEFEYRQ